MTSIQTNNARWLVASLAEVPRHFPLAEFFALEQGLESWPKLVWADRKRWIQFGPGDGQAHIMRKVIGVAHARSLEDGEALPARPSGEYSLWDEPAREAQFFPVPGGMELNWEALEGLAARERRKLPWQSASYWRLGGDAGGALGIYHFKVSISQEFV